MGSVPKIWRCKEFWGQSPVVFRHCNISKSHFDRRSISLLGLLAYFACFGDSPRVGPSEFDHGDHGDCPREDATWGQSPGGIARINASQVRLEVLRIATYER